MLPVSLGPCNFALNAFQDFLYLHILDKLSNVDRTIDFLNFAWGKQVQKSPLNVFIKRFYNNICDIFVNLLNCKN